MTPYKDLVKRIKQLKQVAPAEVFMKANVSPALLYKWCNHESPLLVKYFGLIDGLGLDLVPEISTYNLIEKKIGMQEAKELVLSKYSKAFLYSLKKGDSSYMESYKKVLSVVEFCEQAEQVAA